MQITKYASKNCVKCKVLDRMLNTLKLDVDTQYVEDAGEETFKKAGVVSLPTLLVSNGDKQVKLSNAMTPQMIKEAIAKVSA